jgi:hypothetical protein
MYGDKGNSYIILVGTTKRKRPLGRQRIRKMDVKMFLREIG